MSTDKRLARPSWSFAAGPLRVDAAGRNLVQADGTPFLYLADTAWELLHRTTREDVELYLEKRRQQGFTVVQAVALSELDGLRVPSAYGHVPLVDLDPARPAVRGDGEDDYWKHVDFVLDRALAKGIALALLPTWGDKLGPQGWGKGPEVFTEENARVFGRFLGQRYRERPNLIWVIGGDRPLIWTDGRDFRPLWRALAEGIKQGEAGAPPHLMTFHPVGGQSSSLWMHGEPWLDFNLLQSGHARVDESSYDMVRADLALLPPKPVIDGEPRYEDHPVNFDPANGWFGDHDVRQAAYWAMFAGACGHTYGAHGIWQFLQEGRTPVSKARRGWVESLDLPGAWDIQHLRALLLSRPFLGRVPDPSLINEGQGVGAEHVEACRDQDGRYALLYLPTGNPVTVHLGRLRGGPHFVSWWFDPRTGEVIEGERRTVTRETYRQRYTPPGTPGRGNDWVLVIDDEAAGFAAPGRVG